MNITWTGANAMADERRISVGQAKTKRPSTDEDPTSPATKHVYGRSTPPS
jgi:hypothetical protein